MNLSFAFSLLIGSLSCIDDTLAFAPTGTHSYAQTGTTTSSSSTPLFATMTKTSKPNKKKTPLIQYKPATAFTTTDYEQDYDYDYNFDYNLACEEKVELQQKNTEQSMELAVEEAVELDTIHDNSYANDDDDDVPQPAFFLSTPESVSASTKIKSYTSQQQQQQTKKNKTLSPEELRDIERAVEMKVEKKVEMKVEQEVERAMELRAEAEINAEFMVITQDVDVAVQLLEEEVMSDAEKDAEIKVEGNVYVHVSGQPAVLSVSVPVTELPPNVKKDKKKLSPLELRELERKAEQMVELKCESQVEQQVEQRMEQQVEGYSSIHEKEAEVKVETAAVTVVPSQTQIQIQKVNEENEIKDAEEVCEQEAEVKVQSPSETQVEGDVETNAQDNIEKLVVVAAAAASTEEASAEDETSDDGETDSDSGEAAEVRKEESEIESKVQSIIQMDVEKKVEAEIEEKIELSQNDVGSLSSSVSLPVSSKPAVSMVNNFGAQMEAMTKSTVEELDNVLPGMIESFKNKLHSFFPKAQPSSLLPPPQPTVSASALSSKSPKLQKLEEQISHAAFERKIEMMAEKSVEMMIEKSVESLSEKAAERAVLSIMTTNGSSSETILEDSTAKAITNTNTSTDME